MAWRWPDKAASVSAEPGVEGKGPTEVGVGIHNEEAYEITSGVKEGERVLPTDFGNIPGDRG
jgi:hypothetical protein